MRKTLMVLPVLAIAMVATVTTPVRAQTQQQALTPFQQQVLRGVKKLLTETIEKSRRNFNTYEPAVANNLYQIERIEVLEEVLQSWTDTPDCARYAVAMMDWQGNLSIAIAHMADDYVVQHGHLDAGFDGELRRRTATDPAFTPPEEYLMRHLFGVPDVRSLK